MCTLPHFDLILGRPWLRRVNPHIDWSSGRVSVKPRGRGQVFLPLAEALPCPPVLSVLQLKHAIKCPDNEVYFIHMEGKGDAADERVAPRKQGWEAKLAETLGKFTEFMPEGKFKPGYPPEREVDHTIDTLPSAEPPNRPVYRMSPAELAELKKQLEDLAARGLIRPVPHRMAHQFCSSRKRMEV